MSGSSNILDVTILSDADDDRLLFETAAKFSTWFGFVFDPDAIPSRSLEALVSYEPKIEIATSWPGTIAGAEYWVARYQLASGSIEAFLRSVRKRLVDLDMMSGDPFDCHFLRADGTVVLSSIASEGLWWLSLTDAEVCEIPQHVVARLGLVPPEDPVLAHDRPAWGVRSDVVIAEPILDDPDVYEMLPARAVGPGCFEVCSLPFNSDLKLGDVVSCEWREGKQVRVGDPVPSGRAVVEVVISPLCVDLGDFISDLDRLGLLYEVGHGGLVVVDALNESVGESVMDQITSRVQATNGFSISLR